MVRLLLASSLITLPIALTASELEQIQKFGYEHISLELGAGTTNEEWLNNTNVTALGLDGNYMLTGNWLFNVDYSTQFFHPDDFTLRIDRLKFGGGYRYGINDQFDIYGIYGFGVIKAKATGSNEQVASSNSEFIQGVSIGLNYLLNEKLMAIAEVHLSRSDLMDENNYKMAFNYQWHPVIGTGVYYQFRDTDYKGQASGDINEVGVSFRFIY